MKQQVAAGEFKAKCLHLLDRVEQTRAEIVITKRGRPVARLLPVDHKKAPVLGRMKGSAEVCGDIVAPVDERWEADE